MNVFKKKMNKKGFTLVELIIVIAVMAILAAIVIPRMSGITDSFKEKADERVAETIARELEVIILNGGTLSSTGRLASAELTGSNLSTPTQTGSNLGFYYAYNDTTNTICVFVADTTDGPARITAVLADTVVADVITEMSGGTGVTSYTVRENVAPVQ